MSECLDRYTQPVMHAESMTRHSEMISTIVDQIFGRLLSGYDPIGMFYDVRCPKHCTIGLHISPILRQVQSIVNSTITLLLLRSTLVYDC